MSEYRISGYLKEIAERVIAEKEDLDPLNNVSICYMECNSAKKSNGKVVYADCQKTTDKQFAIAPYHFIITGYTPNIDKLNAEQMKVLMYHELLHAGVEFNDAGMRTFIRPHDYEDFHVIVDKYGSWWSEEGNTEITF